MATLHEISLEVWKGSIPIELVLADDDLSSTTNPQSCFLFLPRMSYLGVVAADAAEYLKSYAIDLASDAWFESGGSPLKCNMPVGVLFDLHCPQGSAHPWRVTVHFRDFPVDKILKCSRESSEKMYMHTLKQALFVLQGNTRAFNAMVIEQQQLLWEASNSGSRGLFDSIATELQGTENVKCVPVRILYKENNQVGERNVTSDTCDYLNNTKKGMSPNLHESTNMISCIQKPVHVLRNQSCGGETLLQDVLQQFLPSLFSNDIDLSESVSILIQGINVPLRSPIMQLWKTCAHADFFLYIIISIR